ncbi:MAG: bifunctional sulfate adenylyltransferase/adenylylsulfate kinase [Verrucomicrobiales bacterium]|nr:bifunctional sulfate adenylyltransferase/adenylylsulfate kinase [Verrucomicrobiales bacterium]
MDNSLNLIPPYGGELKDLVVDNDRAAELKQQSKNWPSWDLTPRQECDLELLLNGGFSPLEGFLNKADYTSVCQSMELADGTLWPIPIQLDVPQSIAETLEVGCSLALRDAEGVMIAVVHIEDIWKPDKAAEAENVYGTTDTEHKGVAHLMDRTHEWYIGGKVEGFQLPQHYDNRSMRHTPVELRAEFAKAGWSKIVAFQTRNPMHRVHIELTMRAVREQQVNLLIHPVVGLTQPGDVDHFTRVRCYQHIMPHYPPQTAMLSLLGLSMRMAGPREAVWHALIRRNHGCTHFIVGRDHAGPSSEKTGEYFYGPYDCHDLLDQLEERTGVKILRFEQLVYNEDKDTYIQKSEAESSDRILNISGSELRSRLQDGRDIPDWFTYPAVVTELRRTHPPRTRQGFTVFFTGFSGSGKSTISRVLLNKMLEIGGRSVTLLDGDLVRKNLSSELGFSRKHRDLNIKRIGFVANEITKNGGVAICAPIAPYAGVRDEIRKLISANGGFILAHVATSLETCESRDRKGLYAKARAGIIPEFTGISDPYEFPENADVVLQTEDRTPEECAQDVILFLEHEGYLNIRS